MARRRCGTKGNPAVAARQQANAIGLLRFFYCVPTTMTSTDRSVLLRPLASLTTTWKLTPTVAQGGWEQLMPP